MTDTHRNDDPRQGSAGAVGTRHLSGGLQKWIHTAVQWRPIHLAYRLALRFVRPIIPIDRHTVMTRTILGDAIFLDTREVHQFPQIAFYGIWEPHVGSVMIDRLRPGMRVVDMGANIGYHTMLMGSRVSPGGEVIAFEANPHTADLLRRGLIVSGYDQMTRVVQKVVADKPGTMQLTCSTAYNGSSSLYPLDPNYGYGDSTTIEVEAVTLDGILEGTDGRVDFIKMDIEGAEPLAFAGMAHCLERNPQIEILMECNPERFAAAGTDAALFLRSLGDRGFRIHLIGSRGTLTASGVDEVLGAGFCDLLLTRG